MQKKVTVEQWHELPEHKRETLRKWAVKHDFGLEIISSNKADTCDYAALLTLDQMKLFLSDIKKSKSDGNIAIPNESEDVWKEIQKYL